MPTFILLTRLSTQTLQQPESFEALERGVSQKVLDHCPTLKWLSSHALLGPWNYMDVIEAPDMETMTRASLLVRNCCEAHTEVWPAIPWSEFKLRLRALAQEG